MCYRCQKKGHYRNECKEILDETMTPQEKGKAAAVAASVSDNDDLEW
jgi:Zinc knuckle